MLAQSALAQFVGPIFLFAPSTCSCICIYPISNPHTPIEVLIPLHLTNSTISVHNVTAHNAPSSPSNALRLPPTYRKHNSQHTSTDILFITNSMEEDWTGSDGRTTYRSIERDGAADTGNEGTLVSSPYRGGNTSLAIGVILMDMC